MNLYRATLLIAAVMLFLTALAALSLSNVFFITLRIVVCGLAVYTAFQAKNSLIQLVGLLMIAVIFNPLVPVDLPQTTWRIIALATAVTFVRLAIKPLQR